MAVQITTLENGMRVVSEHRDFVQSVSLGVWVEIGARHETPEMNGISHMLEHMAFKGTARRSAKQIAEEIEDVGGHINAYTSRENTAYYAKVLKEDVPLAVDMIADILQNSVMDPQELERERQVILQEIAQAVDTPDDIIFDHFQTVAYPDQAMGRPVLGEVDIVKRLSREDILAYMKNNYAASDMIFSAVGNVDHDALVALVRQHFTGLSQNRQAVVDPTRYVGGTFLETRNSVEQVHVVLGFDGVKYDEDDFYALSVFSTLFGGGMSSRLFQEIRENRGLVYSVYSFISAYDDGGLFGIYAGTAAKDIDEMFPVLAQEIVNSCQGISEQEILRAKAQLKSSILMSLESASGRCEQLARQLIVFNRIIDIDEVVDKIEKIDLASLEAVAKRIFSTKPTIAVLGPVDHIPELKIDL